MKITVLRIKNFRKFKEKEFHLTDGINIFSGRNEAGKTTILLALFKVFFTDVTSKSAKLLNEISSWNVNLLPELELNFRIDNEDYRLVRNFENKEQYIFSVSNKSKIKSAAEIRNFIFQNIGIANEDIFTLTALIAQNDIARIGAQKPKEKAAINLRDGIQESLTGTGNVSVENILDKLRKVIMDLERGWHNPARNNGIIKSLEIEQKDLILRIQEIRPHVNKIGSLVQESKDAGEEFKKLDKKVKYLELLISNNKKRKESEKRLKELENLIIEKEAVIQEIERFKKKISEYEDDLRTVNFNKDIEEILEKLNKIRILKQEKFQQIESLNIAIGILRKKLQSRLKYFQIMILSAIPVLAIMSYQLFKVSGSALVFPACLGFLAIIYFFTRKVFLQQFLSQINEKENILKNEKDAAEKLQEEEKSILQRSNVSSENELRIVRDKMSRIKSELEKAQTAFDTLTKGKTLEENKEEQAALLSEKKDLQMNVLTEDIKASFIDPKDEYARLKELEELRRKRESVKELKMKTKLETENKKFSYDDLVRAEEKQARVAQDLEYYKQKAQTLRLVGQFINEARGEVVSSSSRVIAEYMEKYLPVLTDNRYHKVRVSPELEFQIFSDEKNDWLVPDEALSRGTIDQIYFLARMAILKIISNDKKTPIILDDPFVTFDAQRREGVRKVLEDLSKERQVILLTCHDDFNSWGNLITM